MLAERAEHRIERGIDVMEAARRSVYGANHLPPSFESGDIPHGVQPSRFLGVQEVGEMCYLQLGPVAESL